MKKIVFSADAPAPIGPYSQAVLIDDTLYCSGQIPLDARSGALVSGGITQQTQKVCENIAAVLGAAGFGFKDVVKTTCFLTSMSDFAGFNKAYEEYFISKPARSCAAVKELPKGAAVEIEVIAVKN